MSIKYMDRGFSRTTQRAWNVSLEVESYCRPKSDAHLRHLRGERWAGQLLMDDANERWLYQAVCPLGVCQGYGCVIISMDLIWIYVQESWCGTGTDSV